MARIEVEAVLKAMGQDSRGIRRATHAAFASAYGAWQEERHTQGASHAGSGLDLLTLSSQMTGEATDIIRPGTLQTVTKVALANIRRP